MAPRRLIMLLDGTWNDADFGPYDTNIVRLRERIAKYCDAQSVTTPSVHRAPENPSHMVEKTVTNERANIVFYERGVGTDTLSNRIFGGALGIGLDTNIRRAYKFLSFHYEPGDQIYIFGFSRGSYTARSLVGYIAAAGLLKRDKCDEQNERTAWDFYRTPPNDRLPGVWNELTPNVHDRDKLRVECVAVFDTVGALGIPFQDFGRANRKQYEFHDVELSSIVRVNLQALAIDENRWPFQAAAWRRPRFKKINTVVEQTWFAGSHADIGGGYVAEVTRGNSGYLDDVSLDWLVRRLKFHFSDFPIDGSLIPPVVGSISRDTHYLDWLHAPPHDSREGVYKLYRRAWRCIGNLGMSNLSRRETSVGYDRHAIAINEMVHISAIAKLGLLAPGRSRKVAYAPKNLLAACNAISATYSDAGGPSLPVVDWDGRKLDPQSKADKCLVTSALRRAIQPD